MGTSRTLGPRLAEALAFAVDLHGEQTRKGTAIPYVAHLLAVSAIVIEDGGDEDQAVAALLHDTAEDQGGHPVLEEIARRFGDDVARIVEGCSDTLEHPKPPWRPRKEAYLTRLRGEPPEVLRVSLADKVHNARSVLSDHRALGDAVFERFRGGREGTLWYHRAAADLFAELKPGPLQQELERVVAELEARTGTETPPPGAAPPPPTPTSAG